MIKRFKSKTLTGALALIMGAIILISPLTSYAASRPAEFWQKGTVNGDGVRHRATPGPNGTVLGLMYMGDEIWLSSTYDNAYPAWVYLWREKTSQKGWMEWSYFVHS